MHILKYAFPIIILMTSCGQQPDFEGGDIPRPENLFEFSDYRKAIPYKIIKMAPIKFPNRALDQKHEALVAVIYNVDKSGKPFDIRIYSSKGHPETLMSFERRAKINILYSEFSPSYFQGVPVNTFDVITVTNYCLNNENRDDISHRETSCESKDQYLEKKL